MIALAKRSRGIAIFIILVMIGEILAPFSSLALTGGPSQPEVQSFAPVGSSDMVDLFTGDFNYNIPLLDVDGYPLNLGYNGGISMDQEASWVGLGWNLNPGVITRNLRGLPDDFKGDSVKSVIKMKDNITYGASFGLKPEIFGFNKKNGPASLNITAGLHLNNYRGLGFDFGIDPGLGYGNFQSLSAGLGLNFSTSDGFSADMQLSGGVKSEVDANKMETGMGFGGSIGYNSRGGLKTLNYGYNASYSKNGENNINGGFSQELLGKNQTFGTQTYTPNIGTESNSAGASFNFGWGPANYGMHSKFTYGGTVNVTTYPGHEQTKNAYGYLFSESKENNDNVLLDFNREKDVPFIETSSNLPLPAATYDMFSVSAQGIGGTFRTYRNDFPMFHDDTRKQNFSKNGERKKLIQSTLGLELGGGTELKFGVNVSMIFNKTYSGKWTTTNDLKEILDFTKVDNDDDPSYEPGYFRMLGECSPLKTGTLTDIGNKNLTAAFGGMNYLGTELMEYKSNSNPDDLLVKSYTGTGKIHYPDREKRNKLISYLNAEEAMIAGLDKYIQLQNVVNGESNPATIVPRLRMDGGLRKPHHISEITVTGENGQRYVYGIPAYNLKQIEKSFSIESGSTITQSNGQVKYATGDNTTSNSKGSDNYYSSKELPSFTYSHLLTAVLSPDYVDLKNDGVTDDDLGTATKFGYRIIHNGYRWRVPYTDKSANYQEGDKSTTLDDKGSYIYGEKEMWHLRTVEGKNHIAVFELQPRRDGCGVQGENGIIDTTMRSYMLGKIVLYAKKDYQLNGGAAYPIKTVFFNYDYSLCRNVENNSGHSQTINGVSMNTNHGKLTLKSLYFTYGRSNKGRLSPYVFNYSGLNPYYNLKGNDRWGTFKPNWGTSDNLDGKPNNSEYPYTIQNKDSADTYSSAWCLTEIVLPSGGKIQVTYESDDYAYVQDRKAMHMFNIEGFSDSADDKADADAYIFDRKEKKKPKNYVYFKLDKSITGTNKNSVFVKQYLEGLNMIQFDLLALVSPIRTNHYEYVKVYANVDKSKSGVTSDGLYGYLFVESKAISTRKEDDADAKKTVNSIAKGIWQFIKTNVPYELYPLSDRNRKYDGSKDRKVLTTMATALSKVEKIFIGKEKYMFTQGFGSLIKTNKSWIRLNDPDGVKYGGGHRVKQITMNDDWAAMSQDKGDENQTYGQRYIYEVSDTIQNITYSSGVAAYEPGIGCDENPFRIPISTVEDLKWAPDMIHTTDEPIGESYSPAAIVGYSQVKIIPLIPNGIIKQQTGYTLNTFYTSKDYPFKVSFSPIAKSKIEPQFGAYFEKKIYHTTVSQGYLIETNDMHGKPKAQLIFNRFGKVVSGSVNIYSIDDNSPDRLNNTVKTIKNDGTILNSEIGVTVDFYSDVRESNSKTLTATANFNSDLIGLPFAIIPVISLFYFPKQEDRIFQSAVVVKHVNRIGILKKTKAYQENASITTENLMYDYETGNVLLTSVQNEFHDNIYNFSYPAHWAYDNGMGAGYKNTSLILENITFPGDDHIPMFSGNYLNDYLVPGDECILKYSGSTYSNIVHAYMGSDNIINFVYPSGEPLVETNSAHVYTLKVIRSGRRNMQSTPIGSLTTLKNPIKTGSLQFDSILNASSSEYSDNWKIFCNQITESELVCDTLTDIQGAFNLMLLASRNSGGSTYHTGGDSTSYIPGDFLLQITPHQLYDSSSILRNYYDSICRYHHGNDSVFNDTTTSSNSGGYSHQVKLTSIVTQPKKAEYRALFNSTLDTSLRASMGNRFQLLYRVYNQYCYCPEPPGIQFTLFSEDVIPFKAILYFKNVTPYTSELLLGSPNLAYQFKMIAVMSDSSEVEITGYSLCQIFKFKCVEYCSIVNFAQNINPYRAGIKGNWRKVKDYAFSGSRLYQSTKTSPRRDGIYDPNQFTNFWKKDSVRSEATGSYFKSDLTNNKWVWTNEVTKYSPNGPELENKNALNIYSSALYGFRQTLPMAVASNAKYQQIGYESFEDQTTLIDCEKGHFSFIVNLGTDAVLDKKSKHSGKTSLKVKGNHVYRNEISLSDDTYEEFSKEGAHVYKKSRTDCLGTFKPDSGNYVIGAWVRDSVSALDTTFTNPEITVEVLKSGVTTTYHIKSYGEIIDGWQRIEGRFIIPGGATSITFKLKSATSHSSWFDDIRVHPVSANMKSYAYDPLTLRLMADLDENNYAAFYEYDLEGNLARLKRETERGIMTIKETKSSIKGAK